MPVSLFHSRSRRCGWIDLVALRYAIMINGVTDLVMMKSDVLDGFDTIRICTAYQKDGMLTREMPYNTEGWAAVYDDVPGHMPAGSWFQCFRLLL